MKTTMKIVAIATMVMAMMMSMVSAQEIGSAAVEDGSTYTLEEMLLYAYQDESNALKEYEELMAVFGEVAPFVNIAKAEESHLEAVIHLYDYYNLEVPDYEAENYVVPETIDEAYAIGIQAEIDNIAMYEAFLSTDLDYVTERVFTSLMEGSESHLAAFQNALDGTGYGLYQGGRDVSSKGNAAKGNSSRGNASSRGRR